MIGPKKVPNEVVDNSSTLITKFSGQRTDKPRMCYVGM